MEDKILYMVEEDTIETQKMKWVIVNRRPKLSDDIRSHIMQDMERSLFKVFQKYV